MMDRPISATEASRKSVSSCVHAMPPCRGTALFNRISMFRAERGLTRKALADLVDVNRQTIGFLERGDYKPSLELAMKIAQVFDVPVEIVFSLAPFETLSAALQGKESGPAG